jgi:hypothetical protein
MLGTRSLKKAKAARRVGWALDGKGAEKSLPKPPLSAPLPQVQTLFDVDSFYAV